MADDVNANIRIDLDTSDAVASLKTLQAQISAFNQSVIKSNATAVAAQKSMLSTLTAQIGATQQFTTSMVNVESSVSRLGRSIDKNKLSLGEYFRYGVASSKNFGRVFGREHTAIMELAADRVKRLQTQYIALGEAQNGMTRAMAVRPMNLFNADAAISIQRQQLFNKLLNDGSTSLVNFGKNTQWAGRQLMVGFTVPLTIFGGIAGKIFMDLERQVVNFRRVYGDATTPLEETNGMVVQVQELAKEFTKYGISVRDTVALAADAAAAGAQSEDLLAATAQATRLSTLGMIDQQQALTATIALQSAFRLNTEELANSVNFLNAVENQTVVSLADITEAIPKVAPVIQGLGGDVEDLAVFMAALREGGVSAAEGANALKSGLASLINPTKNAREQLEKVGINIDAILAANKGDIQATVRAFGEALMTLDKFERQQTLAKVFGKYQFARLGALFENIARDGSQAQRVVDLTAMSIEELGALAEKELGAIEESIGVKFTAAVEKFKLAIAPIGEVFLRVATPIIDFATKLLEKFNELGPGVKNFIAIMVAGLGVVVPTVIMLIGLFANFAGNAVKGLALVNNLFNRIRGGAGTFEYLSSEQLDAAAAAASLEGQTNSLTGALNIQRTAVNQLARAYGTYTAAAQASAANLPQGFRRPLRGMATGGFVGGTGNKDSEPTLLTPGEFVMNRDATQKFGPILDAMNRGSISQLAEGSRLTQRTHLTGAISVTATEAMLERVTNSTRQMLSVIQKVEQVLGRSISNISKVSNLIVEMPSEFNQAMKSGIGQGQFATQFSATGVEKFKTTAAMAKQDFETLRPHLEILDREIINASKDFAVVGDMNIDEITKKAFSRLPAESRKMLSEIEALSTQYNNLRVSVQDLNRITNEERQRLEAAGISFRTGADPNRQYITAPGMGTASTRTRQETRSSGPTYRRSPLFLSPEIVQESRQLAVVASKAAGDAMIKEMTQASKRAGQVIAPNLMLGANAASPPPWSIQLGGWIGQGIEQGMTGSLADINARLRAQMTTPQGGFLLPPGQTSPLPTGDFANQAKQASGEMSKVKGAAQKFGSALVNGSAKMQGALFAIDGLVFALSFMDNSVGQFAQKILPAVFAIQGISMAIPAISSGITGLAGVLGMTKLGVLGLLGPIGLAVAAIGGLAFVSKMQADKQNEAIKANQKYIDATLGSAAAMNNFAKATNKQTIIQREAALRMPMPELSERQKTFAEEFVAGESGAQITESLKLIAEGPARIQALRAELIQAMAAGYLNPKQAKAVARQVSIELNDPVVGNAVITSIENALTKNGKKLRGAASQAFLGTVITPTISPELLLAEQAIQDVSRATAQMPTFQQGGAQAVQQAAKEIQEQQLTKEQGGAAFQVAATNATKLREAIALLNIDLAEGKITQEQYDESMKAANQRFNEQISLISKLGPAVEGGSDAVGGFFKNYAVMMGMTEEEFGKVEISVANITSMLKNVPDTLSTDLKFSVATGGISVEQLTTLESLFTLGEGQGAKNRREFEFLINSGGDYTPEQITQFYLSIAMYPEYLRKTVEGRFIENGLQDAQKYLVVLNTIKQLPPKLQNIIEPQILGVGTKGLETAAKYLQYLNDIPAKQRKDYVIAVTQLTFRKDMGETLAATQAAAGRGSARAQSALLRARAKGFTPETGTDADAVAAAIQKELDAQIAAITEGAGPGPGPGPGAGEKTKSWLEQFLTDIKANFELFVGDLKNGIPPILSQLRGFGIPEQIISAIGADEEGLKRAKELAKTGIAGMAAISKQFGQVVIGQALFEAQGNVIKKRQETAGRAVLRGRGLEKDVVDAILQDEKAIYTILNGTPNEINQIVASYKEVNNQQNPVEQAIDKIKKDTAETVKGIDKQITAQEKVVRGIQDQIDVLEEKNAADQWAIRNKEREKELIDRQIESLERANEMDERRVETLRRQDELRNREADALSRELDELSRVEEQIRKSYQERIDALDKVAQINSFILNQQKQQLGLSQALSQGDIYAATAAAQEMRASQADFAQQQMRTGLEQGMEGAVAGLTTASGLTRQQAEERINQIKDQSYQTSLQIRDIEDQIYARTQQMIPLKDQQYAIDLQIREIADRIFDRETQINKIRTEQLTPAQTIVDKLNEQKSSIQNITDEQITQLETMVDAADGYDVLTNKAGDLADNWALVGQNIAAANLAAKRGLEALGKAPSPKKGESNKAFASRVATYEQKRADIEATRKKTIESELAKGVAAIPNAVQAYAGGRIMKYGMGKKVMGYATGNVVGTGSRDSVPAMLTPGEFVVRKAMVDKYGTPLLQAINQGAFGMPRFNTQQSTGGNVSVKTQNTSNIMAPMYNNYSVNVSVSNTNASADEIANRTIMKIKQMQDMQIRSGRGY